MIKLKSGESYDPKWIKNYWETYERTQLPLPEQKGHQKPGVWWNFGTAIGRSQDAKPSHTLCLQDSRGSKVVLGTQGIEIWAVVQVISPKILVEKFEINLKRTYLVEYLSPCQMNWRET